MLADVARSGELGRTMERIDVVQFCEHHDPAVCRDRGDTGHGRLMYVGLNHWIVLVTGVTPCWDGGS